jgi:hypothetical protein
MWSMRRWYGKTAPRLSLREKAPPKRWGEVLHLAEKRLVDVPEKLTDFSDQNMPQEIDFERILIDRMIPSDRNTL